MVIFYSFYQKGQLYSLKEGCIQMRYHTLFNSKFSVQSRDLNRTRLMIIYKIHTQKRRTYNTPSFLRRGLRFKLPDIAQE